MTTLAQKRLPSFRTRHASVSYLPSRSEEHTSELQSQSNLVCRLLLEKTNYWPTGWKNTTPALRSLYFSQYGSTTPLALSFGPWEPTFSSYANPPGPSPCPTRTQTPTD